MKKLIRKKNIITIIFDNNEFFDVDKIIIATHAYQALNLLDNLERFPPMSVLATEPSIEKTFLQIYCLFCFCQSLFQNTVCYWSYFVPGKLCFSLLRTILLAKPYCDPSRHPCQRDTLSAVRACGPIFLPWPHYDCLQPRP